MPEIDLRVSALERKLSEVTAERDRLRRYLEVPDANDALTYPMPLNGWTCFHCGETFTTPGAARWHFGSLPTSKPGCLLKVEAGEELGLLARYRELEDRLAEIGANRG